MLQNHLFWFCLLQGDPGGVIGIVPLKGDRGFPGTPGLHVRCCVYVCVPEHAYTCLCASKEKNNLDSVIRIFFTRTSLSSRDQVDLLDLSDLQDLVAIKDPKYVTSKGMDCLLSYTVIDIGCTETHNIYRFIKMADTDEIQDISLFD